MSARFLLAAVVPLALTFTMALPARADEPHDDPFRERPLAVTLVGAFLGSPTGFAGAAIDVAPVPALSLELGAGVGVGGPQTAATVRARPFTLGTNTRLGVGIGASMGNYRPLDICAYGSCDPGRVYEPAYWLNGDVSIEWRLDNGFTIRPSVGVEWNLAPGSYSCELRSQPSACTVDGRTASSEHTEQFPFVAVAVGYAFAL